MSNGPFRYGLRQGDDERTVAALAMVSDFFARQEMAGERDILMAFLRSLPTSDIDGDVVLAREIPGESDMTGCTFLKALDQPCADHVIDAYLRERSEGEKK